MDLLTNYFTRNDITITADGSTFNIRQGQRLLANLYWANRDAKWFSDPDEFQPFRFTNDPVGLLVIIRLRYNSH